MLCGSPDGRGVWGRADTRICMTESLRCPPETIIILLISYTPIENKKFKLKDETKQVCLWTGLNKRDALKEQSTVKNHVPIV